MQRDAALCCISQQETCRKNCEEKSRNRTARLCRISDRAAFFAPNAALSATKRGKMPPETHFSQHNAAHPALQYGTYRSVKRAVLQSKTARFARRSDAAHCTLSTSPSHNPMTSSHLWLHTHFARICRPADFPPLKRQPQTG